jgi:O-antigen/teichoic acid export membrane protein
VQVPYFAIYSIGTISLLWGSSIVIGAALGPSEAALFFAAFRVAATVELVSAAIIAVAGPDLVVATRGLDFGVFIRKLRSVLHTAAIATATVVVPLVVMAEFIVSLFGEEYFDAVATLRLLTSFYAAYGILQVFSAAAIALKMEREIGIVYLAISPIALIAIHYFSLSYGLFGASMSFGVALIFAAVVVAFLVIAKVRQVRSRR